MKKRTAFITICFLCMMMVAGCADSQEKSVLEAEGKKLVQKYLDGLFPGAECLSAHAVTAETDDGREELTDYVSGTYRYENLSYDYYFNVTTGRMFTSKNYSSFRSHIDSNVFDDLGIEHDQVEAFTSNADYFLYLPNLPEQFKPLPVEAVPMEVANVASDVHAYIDDPDRKDVFEVSMEICVDVKRELDFSGFSLDRFYNGAAKQGIYFKNLTIHHALSVTYDRIGYGATPTIIDRETFTKRGEYIGCGNDTAVYELWADETEGDPEANKVVYRKTEYLEPETGEIRMEEEPPDGVPASEPDLQDALAEEAPVQADASPDVTRLYREVVLPLAYRIGEINYEEMRSFAEASGFPFTATEPEEYESDGEIRFESSENTDKLLLKCWPDRDGNAVLESIWYIREGYTGFFSDYCHEKEITFKLTDDTLYEDYEMESPEDVMNALFPEAGELAE